MKYEINDEIRQGLRDVFVGGANALLEGLDSDDPVKCMQAFNSLDMLTDIMTHMDEWRHISMNAGIIAANASNTEHTGWSLEDARHPVIQADYPECTCDNEYLK